jgi:hypothetical protein
MHLERVSLHPDYQSGEWKRIVLQYFVVSLHRARFFVGTIWHLAFLAVMLSVFAPRAGAFWQCEGRACGVVAWACCCVQPTDDHSLDCGPSPLQAQAHLMSAAHSEETSFCVADCHCTQVIQNLVQPLRRTSFAFSLPITTVAVLPAIAVWDAPRTSAAARPIESRGPPTSAFHFVSPSLRAPPVA